MVATVRKAAAAAPAVVGVNFGDLSMYGGGYSIPEGDYVWASLDILDYQAVNAQGASMGPSRLGVMISLQSMVEPAAEFRTQFYSMGGSANKSFAPNPETGKGIVPIPGAPTGTLNQSTNWALLLKSLYDSRLPVGIFTDDVSVLEGMHVHMIPTPEPAERAAFQSKTSEYREERKVQNILTVTEIKEDGKPWEGSGGLLEATAPAAAAAPAKAVAKTAKPNGVAKAQAAPAPAEEDGSEDLLQAALDGTSSVLEVPANADGCQKLMLRTSTFKSVSTKYGADMATAVLDTYFSSDAQLNLLIGQHGYKVVGSAIKPVS
ncbi:MAG: hypothetical protein ACREJN_21435 [Nitrospiraceae bacterium]